MDNNANLPWAPPPEEVIKLFEMLKQKKYINFSWQNPGRKSVSELEATSAPVEPEKVQNTSKTMEKETDDFDFEEERPPSMLRRAPPKTKVKVNKKPVSLAGILSNMERHRIMDSSSGSQ